MTREWAAAAVAGTGTLPLPEVSQPGVDDTPKVLGDGIGDVVARRSSSPVEQLAREGISVHETATDDRVEKRPAGFPHDPGESGGGIWP